MDKIYLLQIEVSDVWDTYKSVDKAFTSYRGASQCLINEGYIPYYDERDDEMYFTIESGYESTSYFAEIIEMEVE